MFLLALIISSQSPQPPVSELIFPLERRHNHASCIVECPNGDLLVSWYRGSGERTADDCEIVGARLRKGEKAWSAPFSMADTPDLPDTNACMTIGKDGVLRLFYGTILNNQWEGSLLKLRESRDYQKPGPPRWAWEHVVHLKPGPEFLAKVKRDFLNVWAPYQKVAPPEVQSRLKAAGEVILKRSEDKLSQRIGWMARAHPTWLDDNRLLLPLYSDGFNFSLMAITGDGGATWKVSEPIIGASNVQPTVVRRKDGTLVAYFRDNGPPPKRVMVSESQDEGMTWSAVQDTAVADPGAGVEVMKLKSGRWLLINNDVERGRNRLSIHVSEDEGKSWLAARSLEDDPPGPTAGSYSYPSVLQTRDGIIHATYSFSPGGGKGESIKHIRFTEEWLLAGMTSR